MKLTCIIVAAFVVLIFNPCSPSRSQGKTLPPMISDVKEVSGKSFDYIIVGGGTTGCPLAATLSEKFSVLLVERGDSPYENPLIYDKGYYGFSLIQTNKYTSVAQSFVSEDGVSNVRGRVLGGSSAINGGFYSRARDDFVKKVGWNMELVKDAYEWVESKIVFKPELTPWQTVIVSSLLESGILPFNGYSLEHLEGTKMGGTTFDEYGIRHTSVDLLEAANPQNLKILLNTTVKSVIIQNNGNNEKIAHGIKFVKSDGNSKLTYKAYVNNTKISRGDIILAAGALGSPQILLLSGIGPKKNLKEFNISTVVDIEGVGQEMKDNPGIALLVDSKPQNRLPDTPQVVGIADNFKIIIEAGIIPISFNATRIRISAKIAFPKSKGELKLKSRDPRQNPSVRFNYLAQEDDNEECARMVKLLERVATSESIFMFLGMAGKNNSFSNEEDLRKFCKKNVRTYYHLHGGCNMGSVVDNNYRVHGVEGLRVVDGSTFMESPGTNPMATLLMLGRYEGIKILKERKSASSTTSFRIQKPDMK